MNEPNCCCEYTDLLGKKRHILQCCCDCEELDNFCSDIICLSQPYNCCYSLKKIMNICKDRIRIVWPGGAKKIEMCHILLVGYMTILVLIGNISIYSSIVVSMLNIIFIKLIVHKYLTEISLSNHLNSFVAYTLICVILFSISIIKSIEHSFNGETSNNNCKTLYFICFSLLLVGCMFSSLTYANKNKFHTVESSEIKDEDNDNINEKYCELCAVKYSQNAYHYLWLNCCITNNNKIYFIMYLISAVLAGLISSFITMDYLFSIYCISSSISTLDQRFQSFRFQTNINIILIPIYMSFIIEVLNLIHRSNKMRIINKTIF